MNTNKIVAGTKTRDVAGKKLVVKNGHEGRKLYMVRGKYNEILIISRNGTVIEVVADFVKQDQRIRQGW